MRLNARPTAVRRDLLYSAASATRTLPYVGHVARGIVTDYARWRAAVRQFEALTGAHPMSGGAAASGGSAATATIAAPDAAARALRREARWLADAIRRALDELGALGCECRDVERGLVDFPAIVDGQPAWLSWQPGEEAVCFWRRRGAGLTARRPLDGVTVLEPTATVDAPPATPGGELPPPARPARAGEASA
jgi:hypothetical protein